MILEEDMERGRERERERKILGGRERKALLKENS